MNSFSICRLQQIYFKIQKKNNVKSVLVLIRPIRHRPIPMSIQVVSLRISLLFLCGSDVMEDFLEAADLCIRNLFCSTYNFSAKLLGEKRGGMVRARERF